MSETCIFPGCNSHPQANGWCVSHGKYYAGVKVQQEARKPIKKQSDKIKAVNKELKVRYAAFLARPENHRCAIKSPVCTGKATTVNHTNGRGANVKNEKDWEPSCWPCNGYIERHHQWAAERGHKKMRHAKT